MTIWSTEQLLRWVKSIEARREQMSLFEVLGVGEGATAEQLRDAFHRLASGAHPDQHRNALGADDLERLVRAYSLVTLAYATLRDGTTRARYQRELGAQVAAPIAAAPIRAATPGVSGSRPDAAVPVAIDPAPAPASGSAPGIAIPRARTSSASGARMSYRSGRITMVPGPGSTPPRPKPASAPPPSTTSAPPRAATPPPTAAPSAATPPANAPRAATPPLTAPAHPGAHTGVSPRAQVYLRKAEAAARTGDLAAAQFNLRLAIATDPGSQSLRTALAQVEAEESRA